ncbi:uncharacterized protein B0I36DRAFT_424498 [Microdochium trichocladiopsis]|uniref:Sulphur transport domain-containing protein n=1 Tax=Microdochium trichocladiopsis TaxID=1682393 RepID=A0A9P9BL77_9PEZI|nr:uncharacterized protein B0I36DRAFT_424498 [Microdochium trichocladiopsis]KAH7024642.1 hypothetical protein B0I36DRAFT_424498 [Microdochium trichocladiopsis]
MAQTSTMLQQAISGAAFGAALTLSGVWVPSVVLGQLKLDDFRMLRMFLTASGTSILIFGLLSGRGLPKSSPRRPSPISGVLGSSGKYAGNIIGGLMQGLGMALAGACASTVLVQAGLGTYPGLYTISGAAAGGFLFIPINSWIQKRNAAMKTKTMGFDQKEKAADPPKLTIYEQIGVSRSTCILAMEAAQVVMIRGLALHKNGSTTTHATDKAFIDPIVGGLLVGLAQTIALSVRGSPLGVSNVFEEMGNILWAGVDAVTSLRGINHRQPRKKLSVTGLAFAGGMVLAAAGITRFVLPAFKDPSTIAALVDRGRPRSLAKSPTALRAMVGGVLIGLGSRISGGCTSGHGISGLGLLSTSSLVTTTCMFGGGIVFAQLL